MSLFHRTDPSFWVGGRARRPPVFATRTVRVGVSATDFLAYDQDGYKNPATYSINCYTPGVLTFAMQIQSNVSTPPLAVPVRVNRILDLLSVVLAIGLLAACAAPAVVDGPLSSSDVSTRIEVENVWSQPAALMEEVALEEMAEAMPCPAAQQTDQGESDQTPTPCPEMDAAMDESGHEMAMDDMVSRGVVYFTLTNNGDATERLVGAETDVAHEAELHQSTIDDAGVVRMRAVEGGLEIPPGGQVSLEPGSYHLMLMGLTQALSLGDKFELTLAFESGATLDVESEVRLPE